MLASSSLCTQCAPAADDLLQLFTVNCTLKKSKFGEDFEIILQCADSLYSVIKGAFGGFLYHASISIEMHWALCQLAYLMPRRAMSILSESFKREIWFT